MTLEEILFTDIPTLAALYRRREVSPVEVTQAVLERITRLEPGLNAFITVLADEALMDARQAEQDFRLGFDRGLLQGVPFSAKDIFDTAGIRTTSGSTHWRDRVPDHTALTVERLLEAGGTLLGKCNLLEFAYGIVHPDFGQCNNPWNIERTAGGSSSGSAASVAAGAGWLSLGTDTGGSIRIPASYCGIVGFKPSYGRLSVDGVFPLSWSLDHAGTLTRTVIDAAIALAILDDQPRRAASQSNLDRMLAGSGSDLKGMRIGVLEEHFSHRDLRPGVKEASLEALEVLKALGAELIEVSIPDLEAADAALLEIILPEAALIHEEMLAAAPEKYAPMTREQLEQGHKSTGINYLKALQYQKQLISSFNRVLNDVDVIVNPTVAFEAPAEDPVVVDGEGSDEARRTGIYNLTGMPAFSVPCGFGQDGLPLGLQFASAHMADEMALKAAHAFEAAAGWRDAHPDLTVDKGGGAG